MTWHHRVARHRSFGKKSKIGIKLFNRLSSYSGHRRRKATCPAPSNSLSARCTDPASTGGRSSGGSWIAAAKVNRSWMRPNRRYVWQGTYLPSRYGRSMGEIVFAIDTSGSMDEQELAMVWSEIRSAADEMNPDAVVVIQCDARVNAIDEYQPRNLPHQIKVKGRGGTDFRPVFKAMEDRRKPACLIYMTDLMGDFPESDPGLADVIWIDTCDPEHAHYRSEHYTPPFGEVIKLKEGERVAGS